MHTINLFLELFGECHILANDKQLLKLPETVKVNWQMLPPGEYPWEKISAHIKKTLNGKSKDSQRLVFNRQEALLSHNPDREFIGNGGFRNYVAYEFKDKNLIVLECVELGNALYVFGDDWERLSQLTKAEILHNNLHKERIIHAVGWEQKLSNLLG